LAGGSLTVVGTGISLAHVTVETQAELDRAGEVWFLVADPVTAAWLKDRRPDARSLHRFYRDGLHRRTIYGAMVDAILEPVRAGRDVCAAFYGHPAVFVSPSHEAVRRAREEGVPTRMLPAVSAEDCLFADLGVDPGASGCQSYEATDFLLRRRSVDVRSALILWQVGVVGRDDYSPVTDTSRIPVLAERLAELYGGDHEVVLYEASPYPAVDPIVERVPVSRLPAAAIGGVTTLYVPPVDGRALDPTMAERLGVATAA
jgi:uncharacterized protein YabN with tetrapyrrole methylase and pyrophosphatase domain